MAIYPVIILFYCLLTRSRRRRIILALTATVALIPQSQAADQSRGVEGKRHRHARDCPPAKSGYLDDLPIAGGAKGAGGRLMSLEDPAKTLPGESNDGQFGRGPPGTRHATLQGGEIRDTKASVASFAGGAASKP